MSLADRLEQLLWARQDAEMRAAGFEVTALGRWHRRYRHPAAVQAALARARASTRVSGRIDPTEAPDPLLNFNTRGAA